MSEDRRRAAVHAAVLGVRPELPEECDAVIAEADAIGRRAARKILVRLGAVGWELPETHQMMADTIEAEVRSTWGTPREGDAVLRLPYEHAVQALTAIVEATGPDRTASENEILGDVRAKFLVALGLA